MTKSESIALFQSLNKLGNLKGVKFAYAVSKNVSLLKPEVESLEKASTASEEFNEFEKKRVALVESFAKKDSEGKPQKTNKDGVDTYLIEDGKQEELDEAFEKLKSENQEVWDARLKQVKEYNELLKTDSSVTLYKVALVDVPSDISVQQMYSISAIVEDATPSPYTK